MAGIDTRGVSAAEAVEEAFPSVGHEFRIHLGEDAFDRVTVRGAADTTREIGGILVGRLCRDAGGVFVRIDATIDALHAEEKGTELTFTHATWDHVHREMEAKHAGAKIVGWYHTHPGFGIFLSDRDQFIHRSFFNLPHQVALVFDPLSREHGFFAWRDNEPVRVRRWWVGKREHLWDGTHPPQGMTKTRKEDPPVTQTQRPDRPPPEREGSDAFTIGAGVLILLGLGAAGGWWFGQRGVEDVSRRADTAIAQSELRGAQRAVTSLQTDLLGAVRTALDADARNRAASVSIDDLDAALAALAAAGEAARPAAERISAAKARLRDLRDTGTRADAVVAQLEGALRSGAGLERDIREHGMVLGQICSLLADSSGRAGDAALARRLLEVAARCDPASADLFARQAAALRSGQEPAQEKPPR